MKITSITSYIVWVGVRNQLLVKVDTDEGIYGWGESGLSGREKAVQGAIEHYREFLIGKDPFQAGAIWQEMYRSQYFEGGRVLTAAISAIDIALYDIKGKALNVPVYQLLGGKQRDRVPTFGTIVSDSVAETVEKAKLLQEHGWKCIRLVAAGQENTSTYEPRESIADTVPMVIKTREALGGDITLGLEYHHRLSVAEAASFCNKLPNGALDFLEEPIRDESPKSYKSLRTMTNVPFAVGEEFSSKWQFMPYIEDDIIQFCRIDICNVGGFTEAMKVAGWCEAHYIDLMPHNPLGPICTAASIHLAAAVTNFSWLEWRNTPAETLNFNAPDVFPVQPELDGADFPVSDKPGLGIEVDEEYVKRQSFKFSEPPHLSRRDGSFTNW
ncbi:mandelate racemase/muconate lactonizing enzyme family protein [Halomonas sp. McH1-25]|uniref:mandelate racemase/muconate lactonizing enzyme family protein n=1 Tax=unclassified Halomonas TaxID=2609666 RepID=UPI001EF66D10|nr:MULTISPECIES: mandelate racemase/muconate lactonizing enzyme family protein [unclassified Halomonas]MCG7599721.1 mandelate racemase/muconate lactonizing enzyme family protein [Halomonas sp. McH1-25]MCP1342805.1 mandelate racemase/muconate lactonizing enzyme family protein [Halomonas sp. FL8]MCP1360875.1 mandelate racemase/muconate lactonizing enzyme family protein [Halomonas sp. BBD45]MCP1364591.1 mandelate racemase/muconate lactonizing enzyme family protein [Halomonas sp. BBD48]